MTIFIGNQPQAKSKALVVLIPLGSPKPLSKPARKWAIACFGNKSHYAPDGSCAHVVEMVKAMPSDWHRARSTFVQFGDNRREPVKVTTLNKEG